MCNFETGPRAMMSMSISPSGDVIATSADHLCTLFRMRDKEKSSQDVVITGQSHGLSLARAGIGSV